MRFAGKPFLAPVAPDVPAHLRQTYSVEPRVRPPLAAADPLRSGGRKSFLTIRDATGRQTAAWSLAYSALLVPVSLAPWALGHLSALYGVPVALAGAVFLGYAWQFATAAGGREIAARRLFLASIAYLPLVLSALLADHVCFV